MGRLAFFGVPREDLAISPRHTFPAYICRAENGRWRVVFQAVVSANGPLCTGQTAKPSKAFQLVAQPLNICKISVAGRGDDLAGTALGITIVPPHLVVVADLFAKPHMHLLPTKPVACSLDLA